MRDDLHKRDVELEQLRKRVHDLEHAQKADLLERIKTDMHISGSTSKCLMYMVSSACVRLCESVFVRDGDLEQLRE